MVTVPRGNLNWQQTPPSPIPGASARKGPCSVPQGRLPPCSCSVVTVVAVAFCQWWWCAALSGLLGSLQRTRHETRRAALYQAYMAAGAQSTTCSQKKKL